MAGVVLVLALLLGALWFLRRKGWAQFSGARRNARPGRPLEVIDRVTLTPHHSLHLVRMADRILLVGLSPTGCTLLESSERANFQAAVSAGSKG
jgi:flagellar biosynthetic protein FliO